MPRLTTLNQLKEDSLIFKTDRSAHFYYAFNTLRGRANLTDVVRYLDWSDENHSHFA